MPNLCPDINFEDEYLDLSKNELSTEALARLFEEDVSCDDMVLYLNVSHNLSINDVKNAEQFTELINKIVHGIESNKVLTALNISGNHLGDTSPHPFSKHITDYFSILSKSLAKTKITHLDISGKIYKIFEKLKIKCFFG